ncbi:hypothetical protein ABES25_10645 [Bacillus gobiensis]|uniref:hypothetical protein n=1 Tax=Bacillus gobiensis TaxID=1441095 RepID=UPI003D1B7BCE
MSKSKARKRREHLVRNTGYSKSVHRGIIPDFSTHVRKTPTKKEQLEKMNKKHKGKNSFDRYESGKKSSFILNKTSIIHQVSFIQSGNERIQEETDAQIQFERAGLDPYKRLLIHLSIH